MRCDPANSLRDPSQYPVKTVRYHEYSIRDVFGEYLTAQMEYSIWREAFFLSLPMLIQASKINPAFSAALLADDCVKEIKSRFCTRSI